MTTSNFWLPGLVGLGFALSLPASGAGITSRNLPTLPAAAAPPLCVAVDPRVELISLLFHLAGNQEYNQGRVASYTEDVTKRFGKLGEHAAVQLARQLRQSRGVSYDACMSLAVLLTDANEPKLKVPLDPWPESLDHRWTASGVSNFVAAARQFVKDALFREFVEQHQSLYETTEIRLRELLAKEAHLEWFGDYFGERPRATFTVIPALLNGGCCYGPHARDAAGKEALFCVLGVWETDSQGLPSFNHGMLETVIHEFCHSYANAIVDRHAAELSGPGQTLYDKVAQAMRSQAYGDKNTMLRESLVRACVVRYVRQYDGEKAAERLIEQEKRNRFLWMKELSELLGEYEAQRQQYPTLEQFAPRLVGFFKDYARDFARDQAALANKRPKVVSMVPANGATDIDPDLAEIKVVFDRPMKEGGWAFVGGGPHCPETRKGAHYDATRTTWTVPVTLKPDWDYEFWLNSGQYDSFRSEDGTPLESVHVRFKTTARKEN